MSVITPSKGKHNCTKIISICDYLGNWLRFLGTTLYVAVKVSSLIIFMSRKFRKLILNQKPIKPGEDKSTNLKSSLFGRRRVQQTSENSQSIFLYSFASQGFSILAKWSQLRIYRLFIGTAHQPCFGWVVSYATSYHLAVVPQSGAEYQFYCTVYYITSNLNCEA